jgi:oligopeptide transport system substrate-binding protein
VSARQRGAEEHRGGAQVGQLRPASLLGDRRLRGPSAFLDIWRTDSANNFTGWSSPDYDALVFAAARTLDPAARNALYAKAERILLSEAPVIPLFHYTHVFLIRPSVHGWYPTWLDHHPYGRVWLGQ